MNPKVVIDTNVWLSGLFWGGKPFKVLDKFYTGKIVPCFSPETFSEWDSEVKSIAEKSGNFDLYLRDYVLIRKNSKFVIPQKKINIARDPDDNKFLEVVLAAEAHFLISGDRDLLSLKKFKTTRISTPSSFLKLFP